MEIIKANRPLAYKFIIAQDNPMCRTIHTDIGRFFLSFPYVAYCLTSGGFYVSFRNKPLKKDCLNTSLRHTGLPNVDHVGVCLGDLFENEMMVKDDNFGLINDTTVEGLKKTISYFWQSQFLVHGEGDWLGPQVIKEHFLSQLIFNNPFAHICIDEGYELWQRKSKADSSYGLKIEWPKIKMPRPMYYKSLVG